VYLTVLQWLCILCEVLFQSVGEEPGTVQELKVVPTDLVPFKNTVIMSDQLFESRNEQENDQRAAIVKQAEGSRLCELSWRIPVSSTDRCGVH
jgi:hypothetical protein